MRDMEKFLGIMHTRFACKRYLNTPLDERMQRMILEAGRLSPSSFGLEGWMFHVVTTPAVRSKLANACFDQESVATAPLCIVITALRADSYEVSGAFVAQRGMRFPGTFEAFIEDYRGYHEYLAESGRIDCWSRAQCYIACANMMSAAASEGIQSCAIEGFDETLVARTINLDHTAWQVALVITFGFPAEEAREKIREPLDRLVRYH